MPFFVMTPSPEITYILGLPFYTYDRQYRPYDIKYDLFFGMYKIEINKVVSISMAGTKVSYACHIMHICPNEIIEKVNLGIGTSTDSKEDAFIKAYRECKKAKFHSPSAEFLEFLSGLEDNYTIKDILE